MKINTKLISQKLTKRSTDLLVGAIVAKFSEQTSTSTTKHRTTECRTYSAVSSDQVEDHAGKAEEKQDHGSSEDQSTAHCEINLTAHTQQMHSSHHYTTKHCHFTRLFL